MKSTAILLIEAGAANFISNGTTLGPKAHELLMQSLRGELGCDAADPKLFNEGFPFRIYRDSGIGYALGRNRPEYTIDGQARTPQEAVEMARNDGVIVTQ